MTNGRHNASFCGFFFCFFFLISLQKMNENIKNNNIEEKLHPKRMVLVVLIQFILGNQNEELKTDVERKKLQL